MANFMVVWHFWLSLLLAVSAIFLVIAVVVGYLVTVQRQKYPRRKE